MSITDVYPSGYTGSRADEVMIRISLTFITDVPGKVFYTVVWSDGYQYTEYSSTMERAGPMSTSAWREFPANAASGSYTLYAQIRLEYGRGATSADTVRAALPVAAALSETPAAVPC